MWSVKARHGLAHLFCSGALAPKALHCVVEQMSSSLSSVTTQPGFSASLCNFYPLFSARTRSRWGWWLCNQLLCWSQTALPESGSLNGKSGRGWMPQTATTLSPCCFLKWQPAKEQSRWGSRPYNQVYNLINYYHSCKKLVTEMGTSWCHRKPAIKSVFLDMLSCVRTEKQPIKISC